MVGIDVVDPLQTRPGLPSTSSGVRTDSVGPPSCSQSVVPHLCPKLSGPEIVTFVFLCGDPHTSSSTGFLPVSLFPLFNFCVVEVFSHSTETGDLGLNLKVGVTRSSKVHLYPSHFKFSKPNCPKENFYKPVSLKRTILETTVTENQRIPVL